MRELGYEPQLARAQSELGRVSLACRRLKDGLRLLSSGAAKARFFDTLRFHAQHQRVSKS
jgi:hypothetical protein